MYFYLILNFFAPEITEYYINKNNNVTFFQGKNKEGWSIWTSKRKYRYIIWKLIVSTYMKKWKPISIPVWTIEYQNKFLFYIIN